MTISASLLRLFVEALEELRVDWHSVLAGCEIDPEQLADPEAQIPQEHFERALSDHPNTLLGHLSFGRSLMRLNDGTLNESAAEALRRATAITPYDAISGLAHRQARALLAAGGRMDSGESAGERDHDPTPSGR